MLEGGGGWGGSVASANKEERRTYLSADEGLLLLPCLLGLELQRRTNQSCGTAA